jgi:hypothetical protein
VIIFLAVYIFCFLAIIGIFHHYIENKVFWARNEETRVVWRIIEIVVIILAAEVYFSKIFPILFKGG